MRRLGLENMKNEIITGKCDIRWRKSGETLLERSSENIGDGCFSVHICATCFSMFGAELPEPIVVKNRCGMRYDKYWLANCLAESTYNQSADPNAPENQSQDFKDGFATGFIEDKKRGQESAITVEYKRRGEVADESFKEWKRGYWAGIFTAIQQKQFGEKV